MSFVRGELCVGRPKDTVARFVKVVVTVVTTVPLLCETTHRPDGLCVMSLAVCTTDLVLLCTTDAACRAFSVSRGIGAILGGVSRVVVSILVTKDCAPIYLLMVNKHGNVALLYVM